MSGVAGTLLRYASEEVNYQQEADVRRHREKSEGSGMYVTAGTCVSRIIKCLLYS